MFLVAGDGVASYHPGGMGQALRFVYLLSLVVWVGAIIFFSFVGAPSTFQAVPVDMAGRVVTKVFPRYYLLGHIAGVVALACGLAMASLAGDWSFRRILPSVLVACMLAIGFYADRGVRTRMDGIRAAMGSSEQAGPAKPELKAQFDRLHKLSVQLNAINLIAGLAVLFLTARDLRL